MLELVAHNYVMEFNFCLPEVRLCGRREKNEPFSLSFVPKNISGGNTFVVGIHFLPNLQFGCDVIILSLRQTSNALLRYVVLTGNGVIS